MSRGNASSTEPSGVLLVDKPAGPTSFDVVRTVRRLYEQKKTGHAGTLDPFATGLLVVCLGWSTRLVPYLQASTKCYDATLVFGVTTDTDDRDGEVIERKDPSSVTSASIREVLPRFVGAIEQVPPVYSAIKVGGRRSYDLARAGAPPDLPPRTVQIDEIELLSVDGERASIRVTCGKGVYIRSIARDLGNALGVGAHLDALRRVRSGSHSVADAIAYDTLERARSSKDAGTDVACPTLLDEYDALRDMPSLSLPSEIIRRLRHGQRIGSYDLPDNPPEEPLGTAFRVADGQGRLSLIAAFEEREDGIVLAPVRVRPRGEHA